MSLRLSNDTFEAKYHNGKWSWNDKNNKIEFVSLRSEVVLPDYAVPAPKIKFGIQFKDYLDQYEEVYWLFIIYAVLGHFEAYNNRNSFLRAKPRSNMVHLRIPQMEGKKGESRNEGKSSSAKPAGGKGGVAPLPN